MRCGANARGRNQALFASFGAGTAQKFIAPMSVKRAGKRMLAAARTMVTSPSSSGWRTASGVCRGVIKRAQTYIYRAA